MHSSDDEIFEEYEERILRRRHFRERHELFFMYNDKQFEQRFRLSKDSCVFLLAQIEERISRQTNRNVPLSPMNMLLITLRFYAVGTFQMVLGDLVGVHKSTICRVIRDVTHEIALLARDLIKPPTSDRERVEMQREFSAMSGLKFWNVVARWQGSTHDSTIFLMSRLRAQFLNREMGNGILLGDGGYACSNFLLTPLANPMTEAEELYNSTHIFTRNCIERAFGVVKRRFPCLSLDLRFKLGRQRSTTLECIVACFAIHNLLLERGENNPPPPDEVIARFYPQADGNEAPLGRRNGGNTVRAALINTHFAAMVERRRGRQNL